ncbi:MAG: CoA activase [Bacteroidetes bacterium]|mgnify:FL=1|jgi:(R)-2-hydroxyacyl-CoA dehydratese activating ATPase|nr:CoA activase [Bacteroidota bacterium]MBT5529270.1 CoA activase [Cytophagia bacterium]MBT3801191.1 CoA activase [Bacteroidota bacterium]MBT3932713.1 CoA activase [Bacteroidota bacterium]MBT4340334.1 CoA activase [Bacteroidota bacterium]
MNIYCGIDIGSSSIKIALLNEEVKLIAHSISPTGSSFRKNATIALDNLLSKHQISQTQIKYVVSTGYGRKLFPTADENISEITANATGSKHSFKNQSVLRSIINIGGQDSKVIVLDANGYVKNFVMNDKCAAGTGRFLEMAARNLEVDIDDLGELHFANKKPPLAVNSTCAVFAESEIISLLAAGHGKEEIASGIHYSIARRIARLASRAGIDDAVLFDGGTALNKGMHAALEDELMRDIFIPEHPQITTAIGAALLAKQAVENK